MDVISKHVRNNEKPKNNASNIAFELFQEKTPSQNSETNKLVLSESNSFETAVNYNKKCT